MILLWEGRGVQLDVRKYMRISQLVKIVEKNMSGNNVFGEKALYRLQVHKCELLQVQIVLEKSKIEAEAKVWDEI